MIFFLLLADIPVRAVPKVAGYDSPSPVSARCGGPVQHEGHRRRDARKGCLRDGQNFAEGASRSSLLGPTGTILHKPRERLHLEQRLGR